MKIYITIALWCLVSVCLAQSEFSSDTEVFATTNFNGRHCRGDRGICSIIIEKTMINANTIISLKNDSIVEFQILRDKLSHSEIGKICDMPPENILIKKDLYFTMEHPFTLSENLKSILEIDPQKTQIKNKSYAITTTEDYLIVTLIIE